MIFEVIVTSMSADGGVHIAPMGVRHEQDLIVVAPFKPSQTLENLHRSGQAVINMTDDVLIFAGCVTGRRHWPTLPAAVIEGRRLEAALAHQEVVVDRFEDDELRPRFYCAVKHEETHRPFRGFNRAQAAVLEAAILVSRLGRLPAEKVDSELAYLQIAMDKTAGEKERLAWTWLLESVQSFRARQAVAEQRA
jgi:hypothetical protein